MSTSSFFARASLVASLGLGGLASSGCDDTFTLDNARARLTWLTVIPQLDTDTAAVHFWLQDLEGDSVDVTLAWVAPGGATTQLKQVAPAHPLTGTVTRDAIGDLNGQEHRVVWDLSGVPTGQGHLVLTSNSTPTDAAELDTWLSPNFDPRDGLEPAVRWEFSP